MAASTAGSTGVVAWWSRYIRPTCFRLAEKPLPGEPGPVTMVTTPADRGPYSHAREGEKHVEEAGVRGPGPEPGRRRRPGAGGGGRGRPAPAGPQDQGPREPLRHRLLLPLAPGRVLRARLGRPLPDRGLLPLAADHALWLRALLEPRLRIPAGRGDGWLPQADRGERRPVPVRADVPGSDRPPQRRVFRELN